MKAPAYLFPQTASVRPPAGYDKFGAVQGETYPSKCRVEPKRSYVRDTSSGEGTESVGILSTARAYFPATKENKVGLKPDGTVEVDGVTYKILTVAPIYGRRKIHHYEVMLQ